MGTGDERDLVERYRRGDGEALAALLARFEGDLQEAAARRLPAAVRQRISVSDILQETRLTAFERRGEFRFGGEGSFRRWVLGIAGNKVLQAIRHHLGTGKRSAKREARGRERPFPGSLASPGPSPSQVAAAGELEVQARRAMAALPPDLREALRLAREEGLTMKEIGIRMGIPPENAKRLYGRAVVRFREGVERMRGPGRG